MPAGKWTAVVTVPYGDVDRGESMLLGRIFKLLQDAAIAHANQYGTGTAAMPARGETWVLNRIAAEIARYPRAGETLRVETWSTGVLGFKGFRDFRVFDAAGAAVVRASSLWLYLSLKSQSIVRVPREIAETFPKGEAPAWCPDLASREWPEAGPDAATFGITLRYGDYDVNQHLNNAAYLDLLQTALAASGIGAHPRRVQMKFARAIPVGATAVDVRIGAAVAGETPFGITLGGVDHAVGAVVFAG